MSLKYEPSSEPLHISVKKLALNPSTVRKVSIPRGSEGLVSTPPPSTLNPQPSNLNPQPYDLNPKPSTINDTHGPQTALKKETAERFPLVSPGDGFSHVDMLGVR